MQNSKIKIEKTIKAKLSLQATVKQWQKHIPIAIRDSKQTIKTIRHLPARGPSMFSVDMCEMYSIDSLEISYKSIVTGEFFDCCTRV